MRRQLSRALQPPGVGGRLRRLRRTDFVHRADDRPEAVATRFEVYRKQTAPILPYYRDRGILRTVDGMGEIDDVTRAIEAILAG